MKFKIAKQQLSLNYPYWLRQAGYAYLKNKAGQESFVRTLGSGFYPRFHIYVQENETELIFNLHLDQKKASYVGTSAHSGEYDSRLVQQELKRLQSLVK